MSNYNSTLQSNNTDLQEILDTINDLQPPGGDQPAPTITIDSSGLINS